MSARREAFVLAVGLALAVLAAVHPRGAGKAFAMVVFGAVTAHCVRSVVRG